ncbi:hypothetical protein K9M74_04825 [Candidatus Woesearchaeota archaeon]|nr:hypothetical protein [Candidatus Woesearchaeota archaeon]
MNRFKLPAKVTFEALDNAPVNKKEVKRETYFQPICFATSEGKNLAEQNMNSFIHFLDEIAQRATIPYSIKKYSAIQQTSEFRQKLFTILDTDEIAQQINPLEEEIKVRAICPT